jgi:hypothetical protein
VRARERSDASQFSRALCALPLLLGFFTAGMVVTVTSAEPAGADQVSSLNAQAKLISQELVQEQLEADAYQQQYSVASEQVANGRVRYNVWPVRRTS